MAGARRPAGAVQTAAHAMIAAEDRVRILRRRHAGRVRIDSPGLEP